MARFIFLTFVENQNDMALQTIRAEMENALMIFAGIFLVIILIITVFIEAMYWKSIFDFIKALFAFFNQKK